MRRILNLSILFFSFLFIVGCDMSAPKIYADDQVLVLGSDFNPLTVASAEDDTDDDPTLEVVSSGVDTSKVGEYQVTYKATDYEGKSSEKTINVSVIEDDEAPVIVTDEIEVVVGSIFNLFDNIYVTDNTTQKITLLLLESDLDVNVVGEYKVLVKAIDAGGNKTQKEITINVTGKPEDYNYPPEIIAESKVIYVGDDFDPLEGVYATDIEDGDLEVTIDEGEVDTSIPGDYVIRYYAADSENVFTKLEVVITVKDKPQNTADGKFVIGSVVTDGETKLQVLNITKGIEDDTYSPDEGNEFVKCEVIIKNVSDSYIDYSTYHFAMANSEGQLFYENYVDVDNAMEDGTLAPGGLVRGFVTFEHPVDDPELTLIYDETLEVDVMSELDSIVPLTASFTPYETDFIIGSIVETSTFHVQVIDYETKASSLYVEPNTGNEIVIVDVIVKNITSSEQYASTFDFMMIDSFGNITYDLFLWEDGMFEDDYIAPNAVRQGRIAFEKPVDDENLMVAYSNSYIEYSPKYIDLSTGLNEYDTLTSDYVSEDVDAVIGSIVEGSHLDLQVAGIEYTDTLDFYSADDGYQYIVVDVLLKNNTEFDTDFDAWYFSVQLSNGDTVDEAWIDFDGYLDGGYLAPGGLARGYVSFEIPVSEVAPVIVFNGAYFDDTDQKVDLSQEEDSFTLMIHDDQATSVEDVVGDIVDADGFIVQVLSVERTDSFELSSATDGYEFVVVDVLVRNDLDDGIMVSGYNFSLVDSHGLISDIEYLTFDDEFELVYLSEGGLTSGKIVFEQRISDDVSILRFDKNYIGDHRAEINLNMEISPVVAVETEYTAETDNVIGSIVEYDGMQLQVVGTTIVKTLDSWTAPDGKNYVIVDLILKNVSSENLSFSSFSFMFTDDLGAMRTYEIPESSNPLPYGELEPDGVIRGEIVFMINEDAENPVLVYEGLGYESGYARINVGTELSSFDLLE